MENLENYSVQDLLRLLYVKEECIRQLEDAIVKVTQSNIENIDVIPSVNEGDFPVENR